MIRRTRSNENNESYTINQDGEVEEILVKDGESVEFDQELIKIKW